jgi:hypothetical protein
MIQRGKDKHNKTQKLQSKRASATMPIELVCLALFLLENGGPWPLSSVASAQSSNYSVQIKNKDWNRMKL